MIEIVWILIERMTTIYKLLSFGKGWGEAFNRPVLIGFLQAQNTVLFFGQGFDDYLFQQSDLYLVQQFDLHFLPCLNGVQCNYSDSPTGETTLRDLDQ